MPAAESSQIVSVDGRRLRLTNLGKVMFPATGTTKGDVVRYYAEIFPVLLPFVAGRPVTRKRWVHGVGTPDDPGEVFFQKDLDPGAPDWVNRRPLAHSSGPKEYPLIGDRATLVWLAQSAALELHVPQWRFARDGTRRNPDRMVLDLDPGEGVGLPECAEVARLARTILLGMNLEPYPVTSGSKGIHLYCALDGRLDSDGVSAVARELARALEADHPDLVVSDMKKSLRQGKVLVDWSQNNGNKTTIAPYSLRGRFEPTVATPRTWEELDEPGLRHLLWEEVLTRVGELGDPLAPLAESAAAGLEPGPEHLDAFAATPEARDRLATYRSMRDAGKTPEPVPADAPASTSGTSFVIQEHHARRLHYDFRLEHDGVLVSWAIPKGPPTSGAENRLAVQTEDHPLEYGTFEGVIPRGEYGAGEVTIWDAGEYELEKWRDGKEVIATLHGRPDGGLGGAPRRYALIHTGRGESEKNWLIHLMEAKGEPHRTAGPADPAPAAGSASVTARVTDSAAAPVAAPPFAPMLASPGTREDIHDERDWSFEMKWDGYRVLAAVERDGVRLFSRNGKELTATFPELPPALRRAVQRDSAVLDGEVVALNAKGVPDFGVLQTRAQLVRPGEVERAMRRTPVHLMLFDLLALDGAAITGDGYDVRRAALAAVVEEQPTVHVPPALDGDYEEACSLSREQGLEGVMAKRRTSRYAPGRRSREWLKLKHERTQEVVVVGWRPGNADTSAMGSLVLGVPAEEGLRYAGHVGTGFSERERREIPAMLEPLRRDDAPVAAVPPAYRRGTNWLEPRLVGEVRYLEWTSGGSLRHPSWRGWRHDKDPEEVVFEDPPRS